MEVNIIETDSGNVATRSSDASMTHREMALSSTHHRTLSGTQKNSDAKTKTDVLDDVMEQAITGLVEGLTSNTNRFEIRRRVIPQGVSAPRDSAKKEAKQMPRSINPA